MDFSTLTVTGVHSAHKLFNDTDAASYRENRPSTAIFLRFEGETEYRFGPHRLISDLTHPVILPRGSSYHWHCLERGSCLYVEFDTDLTAPHPIGFCISDPARLHTLLQRLEQLSRRRPPHFQLAARAMVYEALHLLFSSQTESSPYLPSGKARQIRPALEYMHTHYSDPASNGQLAALCGISTVYFRKLFAAAHGTSPIRYLHRLRIEKAKEMLKSDYGTLSDIALAVGYPNVFHFSKIFKNLTGISPGAYAKGASQG